MDVSTLNAAARYSALRPATQPEPQGSAGAYFRQALEDTVQTVQRGEEAAMQSMLGEGDQHSLVHALSQAELAVETAVTIRDRVVEAYQEILRMPV